MELIQGLITAVLFLLILGVLVVIHELGHFIVARLANVRVLEFGIGFPPRAKVLRSDGETLYTLNWLPIGGFVKLEGEDGGDLDDPRSFARAPFLTRQIILVAGVVMNLALALVIFIAIAWIPNRLLALNIGQVQPGSPAEAAGITPADRIVSIDGVQYDIFDWSLVPTPIQDLRAHAGRRVTLGIMRPDATIAEVPVTLRPPAEAAERGALGVVFEEGRPVSFLDQTFTRDPGEAIATGARRTREAFGLILEGLGQLGASFVDDSETPPPVTGPIGIARQLGDVFWQAGIVPTLFFAGILSANLALVNILPFPPLDGGRMLMMIVKAVAGARVSLRAERLTYVVGFAMLFAFLIWVTYVDITRPLT